MRSRNTIAALSAAVMLAAAAHPLLATDKANMSEEQKRMKAAATTLDEILSIPEKGIPQNMLENAAGVAVVPGVVKAAFIGGGKHGNGVLSARLEDGSWSPPVFIGLTGGSVGWQAGVQSSDIVLVFMSKKAIDDFMDGEFTLGGDVSVAVGPVGRTGSAGADLDLDSEVYVYARSRGVFAGLSLDGTKLYIDKDANAAFYGEGATVHKIVHSDGVKQRESSSKFAAALNERGKKEKS